MSCSLLTSPLSLARLSNTLPRVTDPALRRTPLYEQHAELGAKLVPFAGWEMPVTYEGIREEHAAVRTHAGMFDVSHMGEVEVEGPGALAFLQRVLSNDVAAIELGGAQYSCLCNEEGGVLDDLFTYRLGGDRYLIVTNSANHESDLDWLGRRSRAFDVAVRDVAERYAMLAVQGPHARAIVSRTLSIELPPRMRVGHARVGGRPALVCGTGYTGEDGVELLIDPEIAPAIWAELLDAGVVPCGLGARDTLRLEVCFHLHGNDLTPERNPIEAGLGWCCKEQTGFIGAEAVSRARREGTAEKLAPFEIEGAGIPREGNPVLQGDETVGVVTSGTFSPSLERGIGMAYLRADLAEPGSAVEIDVRGKRRPARVASKPLYEKEK
jgi:aminomethyltransferase